MFGFEPGNTVDTRINRVAASDGVIGYALDALKEGFFGERALSLILLEYEALARAPRPTLQHLYAYLDEPHFEHDFENVEWTPTSSIWRSACQGCTGSGDGSNR